MKVAILYESGEWSDYALLDNLKKLGVDADLINMNTSLELNNLLQYQLVVSRIFASAQFRKNF
ncbi:MAG: hypothetical protein ATN35_01285 [Epulopiscium sp. Nele67-Bin004]|nr:MAG: hypothetical protein ATN35_01285 [Epulopiscium sp. Nele67-Bin004]